MSKPIYLDYMATTPIDDRVIKKMLTCMGKESAFGNPASESHCYGWEAKELVAIAREQVAALIHADAREIIWTSGATEANNLALKGAAHFYSRKGKHIVTCKTEHKAVLNSCHALAREGFEITFLTPESNGLIDLDKLKKVLRDDTIIVSIMHVNNEIGVIQDIAAIGELTRKRGILLHVDAAQASGKVPIDVNNMQVDLMALTAHKIYGPKGIGVLYVKHTPRVRLDSLLHGGGHERGLRPGTLPTQQIVGMGESFNIAAKEMQTESKRLKHLQQILWNGIKDLCGLNVNGDMEERVPGNLNVSFEGVEGEALLLGLNELAVSSGSACTSATIEPSYVLRALGVSDELAHSSIRFTLGRFTTESEIEFAITHIKEVVVRLRQLAP